MIMIIIPISYYECIYTQRVSIYFHENRFEIAPDPEPFHVHSPELCGDSFVCWALII